MRSRPGTGFQYEGFQSFKGCFSFLKVMALPGVPQTCVSVEPTSNRTYGSIFFPGVGEEQWSRFPRNLETGTQLWDKSPSFLDTAEILPVITGAVRCSEDPIPVQQGGPTAESVESRWSEYNGDKPADCIFLWFTPHKQIAWKSLWGGSGYSILVVD